MPFFCKPRKQFGSMFCNSNMGFGFTPGGNQFGVVPPPPLKILKVPAGSKKFWTPGPNRKRYRFILLKDLDAEGQNLKNCSLSFSYPLFLH